MYFEEMIDRTRTLSKRWQGRGDMISLTIGDSDFRLPSPIRDAIVRRLDEGVVGYDGIPGSLNETIIRRLIEHFDWQIDPEWLVFLPGVVPGLNLCCRGLTNTGDAIVSEVPIYYPFLNAPANAGRTLTRLPALRDNGRWLFNQELFEAQAADPANTLLLFCNPQNPLGRVSRRDELFAMAETCLKNGLVICSDDIHCDITYAGHSHIPVASLDREISDITVTLMSASKAFGISGIGGAFAVISNPLLREKFAAACAGVNSGLNAITIAAMQAAFTDCGDWLAEERRYLESNRDLVVNALSDLPGISQVNPEGTYFLWIDFSESGLNDPWGSLCEAGVELSTGDKFGDDQFLRLNFASPKDRLEQAVLRLRRKLGN